MLQRAGFDADDIQGERSQFDVRADGELIFSKQQARRFPDPDEIVAALRPR